MARVTGAWRGMSRELKMAVIAAFALFLSMFLPWYEKSYFANVKGKVAQASDGLSAFGAFSFVEAAVLLVAVAVVVLCFARGEKKPFHLPGGDGIVVMAAGGWVALLLVYRLFDKPDATVPSGAAVTVGIQWGIFFAIAAAGFLVYTGYRIYSAHRPEPPLPGEVRTERVAPAERPATRATEPLVRDQRRVTAATPAGRRIPEGPPPPEARAAADRQAAQYRPPTPPDDPRPSPPPSDRRLWSSESPPPFDGDHPEAERPPSGPLPPLERPAPDAPPEFPHAAGAPPPFPDTADLARPQEEPAPEEADPTVAMPGRRRPARDEKRPDDPPDTLF